MMRRCSWALVAAGLLAGCAPTLAKLPPPETLAELACDGRARAEAKQAPGVLRAHFATATPGEVAVGALETLANAPVTALLLLTAPAWYPVAQSKHEEKLFRQFYLACLQEAEPPAAPEASK